MPEDCRAIGLTVSSRSITTEGEDLRSGVQRGFPMASISALAKVLGVDIGACYDEQTRSGSGGSGRCSAGDEQRSVRTVRLASAEVNQV